MQSRLPPIACLIYNSAPGVCIKNDIWAYIFYMFILAMSITMKLNSCSTYQHLLKNGLIEKVRLFFWFLCLVAILIFFIVIMYPISWLDKISRPLRIRVTYYITMMSFSTSIDQCNPNIRSLHNLLYWNLWRYRSSPIKRV